MGTAGIALAIATDSKTAVTGVFLLAAALNGLNFGVDLLVSLGLEDYETSDSLVCYVDPKSSGCRNIVDLQNASYDADAMPMFRLLAGENSMTFTDPRLGWRNAVSYFFPDALTSPVANLVEQTSGGGSFTVNYVNATTGLVLGILGGINLQKHGSSLVETSNGLGRNTAAFNEGLVDVRRKTFDAAYNAGKMDLTVWNAALAGYEGAFIAASFIPYEPIKLAAKAALGMVTAGVLTESMISNTYAGIKDLSESHQMPIYAEHIGNWYSDRNSFSLVNAGSSEYTPYLMEDFLYERPFVNLALSVSDSALRAVEPGCYYEAEDADERQLCEVGLYGADGKVVASTGKRNYSEFRKGELKFKSTSDWSRMGVKVDRWERVDGLSPEGNLAPKSVPIRHVERYEAPAITVDDWIEKYSFVVDDLMPHRLRQIRMNFNYQEEIAWECDVSKDAQAIDACVVYKRSGGGEWAVNSSVGDSGSVV
ncbi:hypothetical protein [uncultured Fibrobacter sp.]|uniref:hypothetical protein n=1 Tax=uncultured Fibrobacter sp. TaxID=261512 RepID=UPI0028048E3D|nr:hypothetical protein [uncultured Fibrobacter sp.]